MINKLVQDRLIRYIEAHFTMDIHIQAAITCILACIGTLVLTFLFIRYYKSYFQHSTRQFTPETHKIKQTTPTMGGIFIIMATVSSVWLTTIITHPLIFLFCITILLFGLIGLVDDLSKFFYKKGIPAAVKCILQITAAIWICKKMVIDYQMVHTIWVPFLKDNSLHLNQTMSIAWGAFLLIACSNAVNLTDGLDGLATNCLIPNIYTALFLLTVLSHGIITEYFGIVQQDIGILVIPAAALLGSLIGFLWFNTYPALIFMGDVGSLALGAALGYLFFQTQHELLLIISGIIFVLETISVILQVFLYTFFKQRIFKMAPLHHHFELSGMHEARIVKRFSMISWAAAILLIGTFFTFYLYYK